MSQWKTSVTHPLGQVFRFLIENSSTLAPFRVLITSMRYYWWYRRSVTWGKNISDGFACDYKPRLSRTTNENNASAVDVHDLFAFLRLLSAPTGEQDMSTRYKSWIHKYYIDTHSVSSFIKSIMKSLVILVMWLALSGIQVHELHYLLL